MAWEFAEVEWFRAFALISTYVQYSNSCYTYPAKPIRKLRLDWEVFQKLLLDLTRRKLDMAVFRRKGRLVA